MSEPKLISPLLDNYMMGDPISEKPGSRCCPALERDRQTKSIVKIISTPASQAQLDALLLSGAYADTESALKYFRSVAEEIVDEAKVLERLSQLEGFFPYIGCQIEPMTDGIGFDVYALSEYRKTLQSLLRGENLTHLSAVNLGLDICTALAVCRRIGYLYVDLKPENIYLADNKTWKIGDIGFVRLDSLKYASLPERYRSDYTAPEIEDAFASLNTTLDVYALGLVLYRIYNGNQLPANFGNRNSEAPVPPDFADYEMSEIILKACDPNPEKRWQDPIEMGQALVSYMQRNSVNDTPIVPAPAEPTETQVAETRQVTEETPQETETPTEVPIEAPQIPADTEPTEADPADDIAELLSLKADETAPEQNEDQLSGIEVSPEVSDILNQADEVAEHPVPTMEDSINAAEETEQDPIEEQPAQTDTDEESENISAEEATVPATAEAETTEPEDTQEAAEAPATDIVAPQEETKIPKETDGSTEEAPDEVEDDAAENTAQTPEDSGEETEDAPNEEAEEAEEADEADEADEAEIAAEGKKIHWLRNLLIAGFVLLLAALAFLFYTKYYLQAVENLDVVKAPNGEVTIHIVTQTDESKLTVVCADVYGNPRREAVKDGMAVFDDLAPGSAYTVSVEISGFHKLTGETTASFTTPNQIEIIQFEALTGLEDGSVILTFTTKDQDSKEWSVKYTSADGAEVLETFEGHMYTITGLTVGNAYTFTLAPESDIKYTGTTELTHTAQAVVIPENIRIQSIADGKMALSWAAPAGSNAESWKVHCYNADGFDQVLTVDATNAEIAGIDPASPYTVEVSAAGMSMTARYDVPANAVTVAEFTAKESGTALTLDWIAGSANAPESWLLAYTVDGNLSQEVTCDSPAFTLENVIPGAQYSFTLKTADGTDVLGGQLTYQTAKAAKFSDYKITAAKMHFYSCRTPSKSNWSKKDLKNSDYTSTFKIGEKISFLGELKDTYNPSTDKIVTMFVFRDENGAVTAASTSERTWKQMWYQGLGEFDLTTLPETAGAYTVSIYMNGKLAGESKITITQ